MENAEEKAFFSSRSQGSGSGRKILSAEEKRKQGARIAELKKKTKCRKCGKHGHWERECPKHKKDRDSSERVSSNNTDIRKSEAHATITEIPDEGDSSAFMVDVNEYLDDDVWYMDGGATD
ncbi:hypothetical protein KC19_12G000800 [Ceratodon purpureus]|uniref:CCHC-type domain-containing protein n=1 Tax=Ceratodon purpureus TaxID=3225 RepID=A0A8T0G319_CERPU|nr:hypothetical protein KC19_12G000800 [Ceratodon purpureus]